MNIEPKVVALYISPKKGDPMQAVQNVRAIAGAGLGGDRYCAGEGSYSQGKVGKRQVTFMNALFFKDSEFTYADSRRNIFTEGVELMWLIGKEFSICDVTFRGVKYCDPCARPSNLIGKERSY